MYLHAMREPYLLRVSAARHTKTLSVARRWIGLSLLVLPIGCVSGCGWSVKNHLPDEPIRVGAPPAAYRLDLEASSVEYRGDNSPSFMEAWEVRDALGDLLRARAYTVDENRRPAPPARFRATVDVKRNLWPRTWFVLCLDLQVAGCPTGTSEATVDLQLQVGDKLYAGKGESWSVGGLYYYRFSGVPRAIGQAMAAAVNGLTYLGRIAVPRAGTAVTSSTADSAEENASASGGQ